MWPLAVTAFVYAVGVIAFSAGLNRGGIPDRYLVAPSLLLMVCLAAVVEDALSLSDRVALASAGVVTVLLALAVTGFTVGDWRKVPSSWSATVTEAKARCDASGEVELSAGRWGWDVTIVPCVDL